MSEGRKAMPRRDYAPMAEVRGTSSRTCASMVKAEPLLKASGSSMKLDTGDQARKEQGKAYCSLFRKTVLAKPNIASIRSRQPMNGIAVLTQSHVSRKGRVDK